LNIKDLEIFLVIAKTQNVQQAANLCDKSPSMLSKSLKRLEASLGINLFDRIGKHIQLNDKGEKFRFNASNIVAQAKQAKAEFSKLSSTTHFTIAAAPVLLFRWASVLTRTLQSYSPHSAITFTNNFEQQALSQVIQGSADLAIITADLKTKIPENMFYSTLGHLTMQVAAGKSHPLVVNHSSASNTHTNIEELLRYSFVSPSISPYDGQVKGIGCDGWRNDIFPRKLNIIANDYGVLGQIVKSGQALAYLPDYWLRELNLIQLHIDNCPYRCKKQLLLVSYQKNLVHLFNGDK
jgi:DNA-binding transcriptional LysR family regulator